ncbi:MAG: hypothetical protein AAFQ88_09760 [Pseudomonadota bacterium]
MGGILVSIAVAALVALQAASAGAAMRIVVPVAAGMAGIMSAFWTLAIETLFPKPDLWSVLPGLMVQNGVIAALGGAGFVYAAARLIAKIREFKDKYPDR